MENVIRGLFRIPSSEKPTGGIAGTAKWTALSMETDAPAAVGRKTLVQDIEGGS